MASAFPLQWPEGWDRTPATTRRRSRYKVTPERATRNLVYQLTLLGAAQGSIVISTNVPVRRDGLPYANGSAPEDPGVSVHWTTRKHGEQVMACDQWILVHENIHAIGLAVEALRAIERAGASQVLDRAFTAFGALPPAPGVVKARPWWEVLGIPQAAIEAFDLATVDARYRTLAAKAHPDKGGSEAAMSELNAAREQARAHYGAA